MNVICAWCEHEGLPSALGEREPLDDPTTTHGICATHQRQILRELRIRLRPSTSVVMVIDANDAALFDYLVRRADNVAGLEILLDRRHAERRRRAMAVEAERRHEDRRIHEGRTIAPGCSLVRLSWSRADRGTLPGAVPTSGPDDRPRIREPGAAPTHVSRLQDWLGTTTALLAEIVPTLIAHAAQMQRCEIAKEELKRAQGALDEAHDETARFIVMARQSLGEVNRLAEALAARLHCSEVPAPGGRPTGA